MLKEASKSHQQEVFEYVIKNRKNMQRTALRYEIEKILKNLRDKTMEKIATELLGSTPAEVL